MTKSVLLPGVPPITGLEHADIFTDAVAIALRYGNDDLPRRFSHGVYDAALGFSGRGWLIGFDGAGFTTEGVRADFAINEAYLTHPETMGDVVRFLDHAPEFLLNTECQYRLDPVRAAGLIGVSERADGAAIRQHVLETLLVERRPAVALIAPPGVPAVEFALLVGCESGGDVILGRSPYQGEGLGSAGEGDTFRLPEWEQYVVAVTGLGEGERAEWPRHPGFHAIENGLRCARSHSKGARHYGLAAYEAWERALLDDESFAGLDDEALRRRLQYHSATAGVIACQKCFTHLPRCDGPTMGVVEGFVRRAAAAPLLIHGLMWDVWHAAGAYWRMDDPAEVQRFRDPAVRRRAAAVVRRARDVDAQAIADLQTAGEEWQQCLGDGKSHPCPCWHRRCARLGGMG